MTIRERNVWAKPEIDLGGSQGNAYSLLGMAAFYGKQLSMSAEEIEKIQEAMMASDYENLIKVFDEHFGDYVDLVRP